jgi:subtilase family serine protease
VKHSVHRRWIAGLGLGALAIAGPLGSAAGAAAHAPHTRVAHVRAPRVARVAHTHVRATPAARLDSRYFGGLVPVQHGVEAAALPGASVVGTTPADTPESVSFILRERNLPALESAVESGDHADLSVPQFAAAYGQSPSDIYLLEVYLAGFGIQSQSYADDLDVSAVGTAGEFDQALSVTQLEYRVPGRAGRHGAAGVPAQTVHSPSQSPELPSRIAREVLAVLGLSDYSPFTSQAVHADNRVTGADASNANSCVKLTGTADDCNLPSNFDADYGLTGLTQAGATGAGQTLGIVTLAALDPGAPQYFWTHVAKIPATGRTVTVDNVDGGPGLPSDSSGSGETDLDVEQSGGVAPGADVIVYQAPNTDNGFADGFFDAASQNVAGSVSSSWGESETVVKSAVASGTETPAYEQAFDEAFLELAAQGQATFVSAGDSGAYDASGDLGSTNLSVDTPGDSPYVTTAGGTTLAWSGTVTGPSGSAAVSVPIQRAWGWDYLWPAFASTTGETLAEAAETDVVGGGGGFSTNEPEPSYQVGVSGTSSFQAVKYLKPTGFTSLGGIIVPTTWTFDPTPPVTAGTGSHRALPDLSTDADPFSGYLLYEPSFTAIGQPALQGGWGGTSYVAPQLNGSAAVIDSALGHRVGFWNPSIYRFARSSGSPFTPLQQAGTGNDNDYFSGTPGDLYNESTGLGIPNLSRLAADFKA